jgi:hypothetical protein
MTATRKKTSARKQAPARKTARKVTGRKTARKAAPDRWSARVTRESDALDLDRGVFKQTSAKKIAASLKRSAEHSRRCKAGAYRSALSMLTFYINRGQESAEDAAPAPRTRKGRTEARVREEVGPKPVVPAKRSAEPGPITTEPWFATVGINSLRDNTSLWLWVPAFAGTTAAMLRQSS